MQREAIAAAAAAVQAAMGRATRRREGGDHVASGRGEETPNQGGGEDGTRTDG